MFAINIRRLNFIYDKIVVRHVRTRNKRLKPGSNPGLDNRLQAFEQDGIKIQDNDVDEFMEQSESSFYGVDHAYDAHLEETLIGKHQLRHHIVKEKYFKENMPNLLTWSEKEQIRHLATTQPDEWTPQRIAESFPVTEQVAKKLLKYPWKPASEERIARHDASAMRNWKELKEGSFNISAEMCEHFLKFSERTIPPLNKNSIKVDISQEKIGEFEQIVHRCASNEETNNNTEFESSETDPKNTKSFKKDWKRVTLDELAVKIKSRMDKGNDINIPDKIIAESVNIASNKKYYVSEICNEIEIFDDTKQETGLKTIDEQDDEVSPINYPERIRIPKKAYKKDATYKVNDCFYDHDGRFLYRVIGMTDNNN